jgi:5-methylcytosine-specific restriction endonuclease McrA
MKGDSMPYATPELRHKNYLENKEKQLQQSAEWAKSHREACRANYTKWAKKYPEKVKARRKKHYEETREKALAYSARYREENPEEVKEGISKWRKENPEAQRMHGHVRKTRKTMAGGSYTVAEWKILCKKYGYKCLRCKKKRKLTADHVIPIKLGGTSNIDNIQPLCGPCNSKKGAKVIDYRVQGEINAG